MLMRVLLLNFSADHPHVSVQDAAVQKTAFKTDVCLNEGIFSWQNTVNPGF
jgi:hypothetical protein